MPLGYVFRGGWALPAAAIALTQESWLYKCTKNATNPGYSGGTG